MTHKKIAFAFITGAAAIALVAQQSATEAPAGFTTPTLGQAISAKGGANGDSRLAQYQ